ncbi:MAG: DUF3089 domain-containing protein, partial [Lentisphaeria bacterium]|nr:DUF3089 domain-containing protein [Lentisphaeria bacterium]
MKLKLMLALLLSVCGVLAAAETDNLNVPPSPRIESVKYGDASNWVICEAEKPNTDYDVFYVYPTLFADKKRPRMNWRDNPKLRAKTVAFATAQTGIFGDKARVFAPFVRQLDYTRCLSELRPGRDWRISRWLDPGFHDTWAAFQYYLEHLNRGRPYILIGHSQGAMDIYSMMLRTREVAVERGFVAAYLPGLPRLSEEQIASDRLTAATGETDLGVVIVWNTQAPGVDNPFFTGNKTYCINPLNWRTDATSADKTENLGAFFYDYRDGSTHTVPNFCGARVDTER